MYFLNLGVKGLNCKNWTNHQAERHPVHSLIFLPHSRLPSSLWQQQQPASNGLPRTHFVPPTNPPLCHRFPVETPSFWKRALQDDLPAILTHALRPRTTRYARGLGKNQTQSPRSVSGQDGGLWGTSRRNGTNCKRGGEAKEVAKR